VSLVVMAFFSVWCFLIFFAEIGTSDIDFQLGTFFDGCI
jgi:hypothetical protein